MAEKNSQSRPVSLASSVEKPQTSNASSRRILVVAFIASILIVLGIASAVYWRMYRDHATYMREAVSPAH